VSIRQAASTATIDRQQFALLALVTLTWGFNWPMLKIGVTGFPPLTFRSMSMALSLPLLYAIVRHMRIPLRMPQAALPELAKLTLTNMLVWHVVAIIAVQALTSGRAAILGYTMPIFSALWGAALYQQRLSRRHSLGIAAAALGVGCLLWHELAQFEGRPWGALGMLFAAAVWALGTQQLRRSRLQLPTLAIVWWMTVATTVVMILLACVFESERWAAPSAAVWFAILYNAVLIFGLAQPAWLVLARGLPPTASTLSVMLIPVLGTFSGAWLLNERLHWQDGAAIVLMLVAIASVLWPNRAASGVQRPEAG
jgi:drug/metabolite transporter (DMT)-like permease